MSAPDALELIHTLEDYGLIAQTSDDTEIQAALSELALCEPEEGE